MQDVHVSDWSQASRSTKALAAAATILIFGGVYLVYLATSLMEWQGPVSIARNDDNSTLVATYNRLFLIDPDNHLRQLMASDLGLVGPINSVDVEQGQWLLGDDDTGQFFQCARNLHNCRARFPNNKTRMFTRAHGVAFISDHMIVADSDHHRLRVFDNGGREVLVTRTNPVALCYPNSVIALDGYLYVADTNNLRIARIDPKNNYQSETFIQTATGPAFRQANCLDISSHVADRGDAYVNLMLDSAVSMGRFALPPARPQHILPATLLHTSNDLWWVIQMKGKMEQGDVILYSANGIALKRVELPADAEPTSMLETDHGVLITDPTLAKIFEVSLDGELKGEWGPQLLRNEFAKILLTRHRWQSCLPLGWVAIGLGLIAAVIVVIRELLRVKGDWNPAVAKLRPAIVAPAVLNAPEVWLNIEAKFVRQFKRAAWLMMVLLPAILFTQGWVLFHQPPNRANLLLHHNATILLFISTSIALVVTMFCGFIIYCRSRERIGTNGGQLLLDRGYGAAARSDFSDVLVFRNMLLAGRRVINVCSRRGVLLYPSEQFNALILARIPAANFVSSLRFWLAALRRGNGLVWSMVLLILLVIIVQLFPAVLSPGSSALKRW